MAASPYDKFDILPMPPPEPPVEKDSQGSRKNGGKNKDDKNNKDSKEKVKVAGNNKWWLIAIGPWDSRRGFEKWSELMVLAFFDLLFYF